MLKTYRFGFDIWGLILFIIIMLPNIIWFIKPAPNDILRGESVTAIIDTVASICQVLFVTMMSVIINKSAGKIRMTRLIVFTLICIVLYFGGWVLYYFGIVNTLIIILLTLPPCAAFVCYLLDRKNIIALIPASIFTICHLVYGVVNFIC